MSLQVLEIKRQIRNLNSKKYRLNHKFDPIYQAKEKARRKKTYQKHRKKRIAEANEWNKNNRDRINKAARKRYPLIKDRINKQQRERYRRKKDVKDREYARELSDMCIIYRGTEYNRSKKIFL